jgi:hypothetical protein
MTRREVAYSRGAPPRTRHSQAGNGTGHLDVARSHDLAVALSQLAILNPNFYEEHLWTCFVSSL